MAQSDNIRRLRKARKLNQNQLADLVKVDISMISKLENGKTDGSLSLLRKLAAALGVTIAELLDDETCATIERQAG